MGHGGGDARLQRETMQQNRMRDEKKKGYKSRADWKGTYRIIILARVSNYTCNT